MDDGFAAPEGLSEEVLSEPAFAVGEAVAGLLSADLSEFGCVDDVCVEGGALADDPGSDFAAGAEEGFLVNRGGSSPLLSIPTGTSSAFRVVFGSSVPCGRKAPVPTHGVALAELPRSTPLTVKRPCESPPCSASYTVPDSSAIGTGSAL